LSDPEADSEYGESGESELSEKSEGLVNLDGTLNVVYQRAFT